MGQSWRDITTTIKRELKLYRLVVADTRTPWLSRILLGVAVAYLLSPIDLIPDFIPVLGHLDDLVIVPLLVAAAVALVPRAVIDECRRDASLSS